MIYLDQYDNKEEAAEAALSGCEAGSTVEAASVSDDIVLIIRPFWEDEVNLQPTVDEILQGIDEEIAKITAWDDAVEKVAKYNK